MENQRGRVNKYGEMIFSVDQAVTLIQEGVPLSDILIENSFDKTLFNKYADDVLEDSFSLSGESENQTVEQFHKERSEQWNFPVEYHDIDVFRVLINRCASDEERARIELEYKMFEERGLVILLKFLIWLVDDLRSKQIMWGVGRGSSTSSLCLYLIGINRVNPLKYGLDISEFLK